LWKPRGKVNGRKVTRISINTGDAKKEALNSESKKLKRKKFRRRREEIRKMIELLNGLKGPCWLENRNQKRAWVGDRLPATRA